MWVTRQMRPWRWSQRGSRIGCWACPIMVLQKSETYMAPSNPKAMSTGRKAAFFELMTSRRAEAAWRPRAGSSFEMATKWFPRRVAEAMPCW